jgi:hypothetical protein
VEGGTVKDGTTQWRMETDNALVRASDSIIQSAWETAETLGTEDWTWVPATDLEVGFKARFSTVLGFVYEVVLGGNAGVSEPTWPLEEGATVQDGGVLWRAILDPLTSKGYSGGETHVKIVAVPDGAETLTVTNSITILRANGNEERFDRSFEIKITER